MDALQRFLGNSSMLVSVLCLQLASGEAFELSSSGHSNPEGTTLAQQVYDRPDGKDVSSQVVMLLGGKGKKPRQRVLFSYAKDRGKGERSTLMRFIAPADIDGTGLLTLDHPGDDSEQWLYLPALDRVRRISSSRKGGRFVGSDFFYEDLRDREVDMDHHRLVGKGKVGKVACDLLESIPKERSNSVYSKRVSCVHPKTLIAVQIDFFKKGREQPIKRLKARRIKKIQGYWTVLESTMYDLKSGHQTRLVTKKIKYDQNLPGDLFSQRSLSDHSAEKQFRP